jgi:hypothetical protein
MTDVPDIPLEQIQQRVVAMWIGSFYGSSSFVARKLGKRGLREFQDTGARQVAATFRQLGLAEPRDVAMAMATNDKNLFGSHVEVMEKDNFVEIKRHRCGLMEGAKSFSRVGAGLIAREHCRTCVEGHWRKVFTDLKMKLDVEHTEDGCIMRISK